MPFAVKNCSFAQGLAYYALLPVCSMIFSVSLALPLGVVFRRARLIFIVIIAAILSQIVVITYTEPQLFAYNFVLGYFPGITYDETLNGLSTLVPLSRVYACRFALLHRCFFYCCQNGVVRLQTARKYSSVQGQKRRRNSLLHCVHLPLPSCVWPPSAKRTGV